MNAETIITLINEKMLSNNHDKEYYTTNDIIMKNIKKLSLDDQKKLFEWLNNQTTPNGYVYKLQASFYCYELAGLKDKDNNVIENDFNRLAYRLGNPHGIHNLAISASNANDHKLAFELFTQSCTEFQYPQSQSQLANLYLAGIGTIVDETRAIELYETIIANKYSTNEIIGTTMAKLADMCESKNPPQYMEALNWYLNSLLYDNFESYNDIASIYKENMPKNTTNFTLALNYYEKYLAYLIQNDMPIATCMYDIGNLYNKYEQYEKAMEWYCKSEALGDTSACHQIGYLYQHGYGVTKSIHQAISYYKKVEQSFSYWNLGNIYCNNYKDIDQIECDYKLALEMFHKAYLLYETEDDIENMKKCTQQIKLLLDNNYLNITKDVIKSKVLNIDDKKASDVARTKKEISIDEFELVD